MGLGYFKDGNWVSVLPDSPESVDYGNLKEGITVANAMPTLAGDTFYGLPGCSMGGWTSNAVGGTRPTIRYSPFLVPQALTITSAIYWVATANTATLEFYVQQADENWQPIAGTRQTVATGVDASVAGLNEITGLSLTLAPGRWLSTTWVEVNNYFARIWTASVPNLPMMSTSNMQNPPRTFVKFAASTPSDFWTGTTANGGVGNTWHFMLFKWVWA